MFRKKIRHAFAFLCAVILTSSQLAVAAYACPQMLPTNTHASAREANMPPDCAREMGVNPSPLCKAHCTQASQASQVPAMDILPVVWLTLWIVPRLDTPPLAPSHAGRDGPAWLTEGSPPLRIQYQVFRI